MATSSAFFLGHFRTWMGARLMFWSTVRWGKRLNCWKTIPISIRMRSMSRTSLVILQAIKGADERGFAGPRGTEDNHNFALLHLHVDSPKDGKVSVPFMNIAADDDGVEILNCSAHSRRLSNAAPRPRRFPGVDSRRTLSN